VEFVGMVFWEKLKSQQHATAAHKGANHQSKHYQVAFHEILFMAAQYQSSGFARRLYTTSFPCGPENGSGKNRCRIRSSANLTKCNKSYIYQLACCSRSPFLVSLFFEALVVASLTMPQRNDI
jgi:hypothetical protein